VGPLVGNGELTLIGSVRVDLKQFQTGVTSINDWFDLEIDRATLEAGRLISEAQHALRHEEHPDATHHSKSSQSETPFHQLRPRVQLSVTLARALISAEEEKQSNRLSIEMMEVQKLPLKWLKGVPSLDFTHDFSVMYDVHLSDSYTREISVGGGQLVARGLVVDDEASAVEAANHSHDKKHKKHSTKKHSKKKTPRPSSPGTYFSL